jgi:pilus assembly protein CpaE
MPKALAIDDDPIILKIVASTLTRLGYSVATASDGLKGLSAVKAERPDVVITDVMMPGINGYEVTRRLRRDPEFAHIPVLVLTSQAELEEKLMAFEAGADDYLNKPVEPAELAARLNVLLRHAETAKLAQSLGVTLADPARVIAVHSLRGGVGCSSLAANLAVGLARLWEVPTLLADFVFTAGQIALMLNLPLKRTWADLERVDTGELDYELLRTIIGQHASGVEMIATPTSLIEAEGISPALLNAALEILRARYAYIVADLQHDFGEVALMVLETADLIVVPIAPELSSVRAAAAALEVYGKLGYEKDKIRLVLNWTFERNGLARKSIENALHMTVALSIPFAPDRFVGAINQGRPFLSEDKSDPVATSLEDFAFQISKERHQSMPPAVPSGMWQRVSKRLASSTGARR